MSASIHIAIAQLNPTVGDLAGNVALIRDAHGRAAAAGADLLVTPEQSLVGYPTEDLVLKPAFIAAAEACVSRLAALTSNGAPAMIVGTPWRVDGRLYNAALLLENGVVAAMALKCELPNYGVFDEKRIFAAAEDVAPVPFRGLRLGLMICEDMWYPATARRLADAGADLLIVPTASPFETDKVAQRLIEARARVRETGLPLLFVNQVGGQDEVIFDGTSFALDTRGRQVAQSIGFAPDFDCLSFAGGAFSPGRIVPPYDDLEAIWRAMALGLADYIGKNGFPGVLIGLSGGIDSALSTALAVDALGADAVHCVMMPSPYTSRESLEDAAECAARLGVRLDRIAITPGMEAFTQMLAPSFEGRAPDVTEENIQSRLRGMLLMALSNKFGKLVLTTGNKSEVSVGYATLYGDMCGGYSVLKDIYKTTVFKLARWRNVCLPEGMKGPGGVVIPERIILRPPTAELRPGQKDEDSLPPYEVLDEILQCLVERNMAHEDIVALGHEAATVARVESLLLGAEYKRRQAAPGVKITRKSFGRDRRMPITNRFRSASPPCR
ncbi:MAG: NAD+ synthase [Rhodothalassiaceae bacterium]